MGNKLYNNPAHSNPHSSASPKVLSKDEIQDAARETSQVVDANDDA